MTSLLISNKLNVQKSFDFDKKNSSFFNRNEEEEAPKKIMKKSTFKVFEPSNNTSHHMDIIANDQVIEIQFQEEIIMEILSRLPVRSLHRFKCVSKVWKALISDPYFKMKHLNRAKDDQNSQKFLVFKSCFDKKKSTDKITHFYSSSLSSVELIEDEKELDFPPNWTPRCTWILGSCDGLVLIKFFDLRINKEILLLWNPSTRESIELPLPRLLPLQYCLCGMGYDTTSDDYKIIMINLSSFTHAEISSEILALKSGSWRSCEYPTGIRRVFGVWDSGMDYLAFVRGAFHWVGSLSQDYIIVSFNISNEVYGEIPLLEQMCHNLERKKLSDNIDFGVSILEGMLCFYSTYNKGGEGHCKLWVMRDYGVKESWTILFAIQDSNLYSVRPRYRYTDGEVLLRCRHREFILFYEYKTSRGPFGVWPSRLKHKQEVVYTESLISPKLFACV